MVTIRGANFGPRQGSSTVTFSGVPAEVTEWNDHNVTTWVPPGATSGPVVVTVAGQGSNGVTFTVDRGSGSGLLAITSPANGAVFAPGQTVTVNVSSPDNSTLVNVFVQAQSPIEGTAGGAPAVPAQFTLTIPKNIESRKYSLTAFANTWAGRRVSTSIAISVERPGHADRRVPSAATDHLYGGRRARGHRFQHRSPMAVSLT